MDDLKKCPCCGGAPLVFDSDAHWKQVICKTCGIRTPLMPDGEEAVKIWNRREDQERKAGAVYYIVPDAVMQNTIDNSKNEREYAISIGFHGLCGFHEGVIAVCEAIQKFAKRVYQGEDET